MPSDAAIPARFTNACICVCMPGALQYASYVTTREEYAVQRYEGASTLFGPATLDAYIHVTLQLVRAMLAGEAVPSGPTPPDLLVRQIGLLPPVVMDAVPHGAAFGDVVAQPAEGYAPGDTAEAVFRSGCPRNNVRRGGSFLAVQRRDACGVWHDVASDAEWETQMFWERHAILSTHSFATVRRVAVRPCAFASVCTHTMVSWPASTS